MWTVTQSGINCIVFPSFGEKIGRSKPVIPTFILPINHNQTIRYDRHDCRRQSHNQWDANDCAGYQYASKVKKSGFYSSSLKRAVHVPQFMMKGLIFLLLIHGKDYISPLTPYTPQHPIKKPYKYGFAYPGR